jgi:hypothetical protein
VPRYYVPSESCRLVSVERPLWREDGSAVCSAIIRWSELRTARNHTYCNYSLSNKVALHESYECTTSLYHESFVRKLSNHEVKFIKGRLGLPSLKRIYSERISGTLHWAIKEKWSIHSLMAQVRILRYFQFFIGNSFCSNVFTFCFCTTYVHTVYVLLIVYITLPSGISPIAVANKYI